MNHMEKEVRHAAGAGLSPIDVSPYRRGNTGVDYCHRIDSGVPGPTVLINGLSKGDEVCGMAAVTALLDRPPRLARGSLVLCLANVAAYERFDPADPIAAKFIDRNFNRVWRDDLLDDAHAHGVEVERARAMRPLVVGADIVLDVMSNCHWRNDDAAWCDPPLLAFIDKPEARKIAARIPDPRHHIACARSPGGGMLYEYGNLSRPASPAVGLLSESGPHLSAHARDTGLRAAWHVLAAAGLIDAEAAVENAPVASVGAPILYDRMMVPVAKTDRFRWAGDFRGHEAFSQGDIIAWDGDEPLRAPYDDCVLIAVAPTVPKGTGAGHLIHRTAPA